MAIKTIPDGYHTVTPCVLVNDVVSLIDFLQQVFDAKETERMVDPNGRIMHAEVRIGDSLIMMGEVSEGNPTIPAMFYLYLEDCEAAYQRAMAAGATSLQEPRAEFYGDRTAAVRDASGCQWWLATRVEEVSVEEMEKRSSATYEKR